MVSPSPNPTLRSELTDVTVTITVETTVVGTRTCEVTTSVMVCTWVIVSIWGLRGAQSDGQLSELHEQADS
jgi:hypothetical protein